MPQKGATCFEPERDIVAAPYSYRQEAIANETYSSYDPEQIPNERLLFFAGSIHTDEPEYSGGVRQVGGGAWVMPSYTAQQQPHVLKQLCMQAAETAASLLLPCNCDLGCRY
jgi:hypothetical protein